jgi:hypothetical protein
MVDWLGAEGVLAGQDPMYPKHYHQTLVRWLLCFLPRRHRLEEPHYSELFGRVEEG